MSQPLRTHNHASASPPAITNLQSSSPLTLVVSLRLLLVLGNAGPIRLCSVLDRALSLRAFVGVAKQHVSCGEAESNLTVLLLAAAEVIQPA